MMFERLVVANKKAQKRWDYFHAGHEYRDFVERGMLGEYPAMGKYRKCKGCECRLCSRMKWEIKYEDRHKTRREAAQIKRTLLVS